MKEELNRKNGLFRVSPPLPPSLAVDTVWYDTNVGRVNSHVCRDILSSWVILVSLDFGSKV
jgi:hypothetical protein